MSRRWRLLPGVAVAAGLCALLATPVRGRAQQSQGQTQPPPGPPGPTFKAGINFVRVDVHVLDKQGNPVTNLKPSDFQIREDGQLQTIQTFQLISVDQNQPVGAEPEAPIRTPEQQQQAAAADNVRIVAIFLDDYHVERGDSMAVRAQLEKFLETNLAPSDLVAIMYPLTPIADVTLSRDHKAAAKAIESFLGRKYDYTPRNDIEERYANYPAETVEQIRNQVSLSALKGLVTYLGTLREGRKAVLLVSEGYTDYLPPQMRDPIASAPGLLNPSRGDPEAGEGNPREEAQQFFSGLNVQEDLQNVYREANRDNASIYALDPRGLAPFEYGIDQGVGARMDSRMLSQMQDTLRVLADETDGRAIINQNDMSKGLAQLARDSSHYYLIGYTSSRAPSDGKFHEIKVSVNHPGVSVRARRGYWALTAEETARAKAPAATAKPGPAPEVMKALATVASTAHHDVVKTWVGTSRGENGKTQVTFVWQPVPPAYGDRASDGQQPSRVMLTAIAPDGSPYFRGPVPQNGETSTAATDSARDGRGGASGGSPSAAQASKVVFEAAPGPMKLQMSVQASDGHVLDFNDTAVQVPDFTAPQVTLSTPALLVARNAYELHQLTSAGNAVPTPGREFSRTDRLLIRFQAYAPGGAAPTLTASLLNRAGQSMATLPISAGQNGLQQIDLPLATFPVGEYLVKVEATSGASKASTLVAFRVVS